MNKNMKTAHDRFYKQMLPAKKHKLEIEDKALRNRTDLFHRQKFSIDKTNIIIDDYKGKLECNTSMN